MPCFLDTRAPMLRTSAFALPKNQSKRIALPQVCAKSQHKTWSVAGPTPPRHSGPTHPPANRPLPLENKTCTQYCLCKSNVDVYLVRLYKHICLDHNVYSARAKPCQGTQAHKARKSRRHTRTKAHAHKHSTHTFMLHVCCTVVRDELNWFLQHVQRQYNKMEIDILCGRARL